MDVSLEQVRKFLEEQLEPLDTQADALEAQLIALNDSRNRLRAAVNSLTYSTEATRTQNDRKRIRKEVLIQLIEDVLCEKGPLEVKLLDKEVRSRARALDYSLSGFGPCKKAALNAPQFTRDAQDRVATTKLPTSSEDAGRSAKLSTGRR